MVREGSPLDLYCESSTPYQWCYRAHNSSRTPHQYLEYPTTAHQGGGEVREATLWGFQWRKSSTRCGLHVPAAKVQLEGSWKCHLADTDAPEVENIRDERWSSVEVARPATPLLSLPPASVREGALEVVWGQEVTVGCSAPGGVPPAEVALSLEKTTDQAELGSGSRAQVAYYPSVRETGAVFVCRWRQLGPEGELLYSGEERAPPLLVLMAPTLAPDTRSQLVWGPGLVISALFTARPRPQEAEVQWLLMAGNTTMEVGESEGPGQFRPLPLLEVAGGSWQWEARLEVPVLRRGVSLALLLANRAGSTEVRYSLQLPPAPQPRSSQDQVGGPPLSPPPPRARPRAPASSPCTKAPSQGWPEAWASLCSSSSSPSCSVGNERRATPT